MTDATLEGLPPELLGLVADFCLDQSVFDLRLTSRAVEAAVHYEWLHRFFSARTLELTSEHLASVKKIVEILEYAAVTNTIVVRCIDTDATQEETSQGEEWSAAFYLALVLSRLRNLKSVVFVPTFSSLSGETNEDGDDVVDYSSSFHFVMRAIQACELRPKCIKFSAVLEEYVGAVKKRDKVEFKMGDLDNINQLTSCLSEVETFEIGIDAVPAPARANSFAIGIHSMPLLRRLALRFSNDGRGNAIIKGLASATHLPALANIEFRNVFCNVHNLMQFLHKHADTVTVCTLKGIISSGPHAISYFQLLLVMLRDAMHLDQLAIADLKDERRRTLAFPTLRQNKVSLSNSSNEDDSQAAHADLDGRECDNIATTDTGEDDSVSIESDETIDSDAEAWWMVDNYSQAPGPSRVRSQARNRSKQESLLCCKIS